MAALGRPNASLVERAQIVHGETPFYSRNYGGFTIAQWDFFRQHVGLLKSKTILDPMGGQAFYLSRLAWEGLRIYVGDINPAPLLLASMRDPEAILRVDLLRKSILRKLDTLKPQAGPHMQYEFVEDWVATSIRLELLEYFRIFDLKKMGSPVGRSTRFWSSPLELRIAAALPVLAARSLTCFRVSDNVTWLKKGGLQREQCVYHALRQALDRWCLFAKSVIKEYERKDLSRGELHVSHMDAESGDFGGAPNADIIINSPPYANRLDYTRAWAPELAIVATMFDIESDIIKAKQIGSTVIRKKTLPKDLERRLPAQVRRALREIREDKKNVSSDSYYYPFFLNYAVSLQRAMQEMARHLRRGGRMFIFVRDTVRKDTLLAVGQLVEKSLQSNGLVLLEESTKQVVRSHVGMRRRAARASLYGLAQTEWWLVFGGE
jgi:hypothetical protein